MIKTLVVLFVAVIVTIPATAGGLIEFGVKVSGNVTHPGSLSDGISSVDELGFGGGLFGQIGLGDLIAVGAELTYDGRSFTLTNDVLGSDEASVMIRAKTLNLPLILKIGLPLDFMAEIGVQYSHFMGGNEVIVNDGQGLALLGLVWSPLEKLRIGFRFQPGLSPIEIDGFDEVATSVSQIYIGYVLF